MASSNDFALYMNRKIHDAEGEGGSLDFICSTMLGLARQQALRRVFRRYDQCLRLLNVAFKREEYWMIPQVVLRVAQALPPFFIHLWGEGIEDVATLPVPDEEALNSQLLCYEPDVLGYEGGLRDLPGELKQGVYY